MGWTSPGCAAPHQPGLPQRRELACLNPPVSTEIPMGAAGQPEEDEGEAGRRDRGDLLRRISGWGHKRKCQTIHLSRNSVVSSAQAECVLQGFVKFLSGLPH